MIKSRLAAVTIGVLAAGTTLGMAAPAMALAPLPPTCAASTTPPPLYSAPCTPTVTGTNPIPAGGGSVTLTLPGVGSIVITVDKSGNLTAPTVTPTAPFAMGTLTVNNTTGLVSVTFTNKASVAPGVKPETYAIKAKVIALPGSPGGFAVRAVAKPVTHHKHHGDEGNGDDKQGDNDSQGPPGGANASLTATTGGHSHGGGGDGGQD